jgi:hypothetical protein
MAYTYAQLEGLWIQAGGSRALAPIMAAVALAESSGDPNAKNPNDNGGTQTSWGLWQISDGTHNEPVPNILDPKINAQEAVKKVQSQGLKAWGSYTSGAYQKYMQQNITPVNVTGSTTTANDAGWLDNPLGTAAGDIGNAIGKGFAAAFSALFKPVINLMIWGSETVLGIALVVGGVLMVIANSAPVKEEEKKLVGAYLGGKGGKSEELPTSPPPTVKPPTKITPSKSPEPRPGSTKNPRNYPQLAGTQDYVKLKNSGYKGMVYDPRSGKTYKFGPAS